MRHCAKQTTCVLALAAPLFVLPGIAMAAGDAILYVDDDAPPGGDGLTWNTAYRFLADALAAPGELSEAGEIRVGRGAYTPDRSEGAPRGSGDRQAALELIDGWVLLGGFAGYGAEDPDDRDVVKFETVLSGDLLGNDGPDFANNGENSASTSCGRTTSTRRSTASRSALATPTVSSSMRNKARGSPSSKQT